jgi:nicotinate-nucleotide pyrophosphorylase (carboxylating)
VIRLIADVLAVFIAGKGYAQQRKLEKTLSGISRFAQRRIAIDVLAQIGLGHIADAVAIVAGRAKLEASGGITLKRLASIGQIGVDFVSSGALTHSVRSMDISLDIEVAK